MVYVWSRVVYTPENVFLFPTSGFLRNIHVGSNIDTHGPNGFHHTWAVQVIILLNYS